MPESHHISFNELKIGIEYCSHVSNRLLTDAEFLLKNNSLPSAIALGILAREEIGKAEYFRKTIEQKKGILKNEWEKLFLHNIKLTKITKTRSDALSSLSSSELRNLSEINKALGFGSIINPDQDKNYTHELFEVLSKLNKIKQACFYVDRDFKNEKWHYLEKEFNKYQQKALAIYIILTTRRNFYILQLLLEMSNENLNQLSDEEQDKIFKKSKYCKKLIKINDEINKKFLTFFDVGYELIKNY